MSYSEFLTGVMTRFKKEDLKTRLLKLAALQSTGAPAELAGRFDVSERQVKRMVRELRDTGTKIRYSPVLRSYITGEEGQS
jgi:predicted DNA-binding transcriptional regulator YafY